MMTISHRANKVEASEIRKAFELAKRLKDPIDLSIGQPHFEVPAPVKDAAIQAIRDGFNRYTSTQGIPELREKIAEIFKEEFGFSPPALLVTSGTAGALTLALMTILDENDEVLITDPYFAMYKHLVNSLGGVVKFIDIYPDFRLKKEKITPLITPRTKAIVFCTPANPTGVVYSKEEILMLVEIAREHNLLIITDEIYRTFAYDTRVESPISYYDNTLVINGLSKAFGMPGWRLGYAIGPAEMIEQMTVLQQWSFICAPAPFQKAAVVALDYDMSEYIKDYHRKRDMVYEALKDKYEIVKPNGSFYFFPKAPNGDAMAFVEAAINYNLLLVPGIAFSNHNTHFRISYAASDEKLHKGLEILRKLA